MGSSSSSSDITCDDALGIRDAEELGVEQQVLAAGEVRVEQRLMGDEADAASQPGDRLAACRLPAIETEPRSGPRDRPPCARRVVLPAPFEPIRATYSPSSMVRETSFEDRRPAEFLGHSREDERRRGRAGVPARVSGSRLGHDSAAALAGGTGRLELGRALGEQVRRGEGTVGLQGALGDHLGAGLGSGGERRGGATAVDHGHGGLAVGDLELRCARGVSLTEPLTSWPARRTGSAECSVMISVGVL